MHVFFAVVVSSLATTSVEAIQRRSNSISSNVILFVIHSDLYCIIDVAIINVCFCKAAAGQAKPLPTVPASPGNNSLRSPAVNCFIFIINYY
jgi:hypothetical protein